MFVRGLIKIGQYNCMNCCFDHVKSALMAAIDKTDVFNPFDFCAGL